MSTLRPPRRRQRLHNTGRHASSLGQTAVLASSAFLVLVLALIAVIGVRSVAPTAYAAALVDPTPTTPVSVTETLTATSTPTTPPTISLVSPTSGKGPVGAHLTINGGNFPAGATALIFASSASDCSQQAAGIGTGTANGGGSFTTKFLWPIALNGGTFYICASGVTSGAPSYQVLSPTAPALSLSAPSITAGQSLTITGSGFVGLPDPGTVLLAEVDSKGHAVTIQSPVVGSDGSFTTTWTVSPTPGTMTIRAFSQPEGNADAVLQATAQLVVIAAGSPTASVTVTPTPSSGAVSPANQQHGGASGLVVALVVIAALLLLAGLGVAAFVLLRKRNDPSEALYGDGGYGPGEYPGFAARNRDTMKVPGIGQTGRQPAIGSFGNSGLFGVAGGPGEPRIGGVAQWDEPDPLPGPDWQPRPMSGRPHDYDPADYGDSFGGATNPAGSVVRQDGYPALEFPPLDPWARQGGAPQGRQSPPRPPARGGGPSSPRERRSGEDTNRDWWGNTTNPANDDQ
jgi:hypothetical protein